MIELFFDAQNIVTHYHGNTHKSFSMKHCNLGSALFVKLKKIVNSIDELF
jgi:hypothetical protein